MKLKIKMTLMNKYGIPLIMIHMNLVKFYNNLVEKACNKMNLPEFT